MLHVTVPQIPGAKVRARRGGGNWTITARGVHALQRLAAVSVGAGRLAEVDVQVESWRPPTPGWLGHPRVPGIAELQIVPEGRGVHVRIAFAPEVDAAVALAAVVRCLRPVATGDRLPELTFTAGLPEEAASLTPQLRDVHVAGEKRDRHLRRSDTLLVGAAPGPEVERAVTVTVARDCWLRDDVAFDVCVDPTIHRPVGRRSTGGVVARGVQSSAALTITAENISVVVEGSVSAANARALRGVRALVIDQDLPDRVRRQLNACGIPVASTADALPAEDDHLGWQAWSVLERRHAIRQYGPSVALVAWPSVSIILATHRPDHLDHALRQLSGLRYPDLEVVIGVHGPSVDAARIWEMAQDIPHRATVVAVDAGATLGEVLQACSDRAEGALITKMDDDDFYGPEHIWDLVVARLYSGAEIVGKALDWIYLESGDATVFRPVYPAEKYSDFVAGGTILISRADLMAVGGWRPVPKSVDRALLDRVLADGGLVYRTHGLGYVYVRHSAGHTATVSDEHFLTRIEGRYDGLVVHEAFGTEAR